MENSRGKKIPEKLKIVLIAVAILIAVLAVWAVSFQFIESFKAENNSIVVYKKGTENVIRIRDSEKTVSDLTATNFKIDAENNRVFYLAESSARNLYDLYYVEKRHGEISEPHIIDTEVSDNYTVSSGDIYFLKKNKSAGAFEGCVCNIDDKKIETFSQNVDSIYNLKNSDFFYFTKMHNKNRVLYKCENGEAKEICRDLVSVYTYNNCENPHILYERKSQINSGMTELFISYSNSEPQMICDNTYLVMYDDYAGDGNLYYFTSSSESISWSYVISDQYAEDDLTVEKPKIDNFLAFFGISQEYNEALKRYQDKLIRDEIRVALNESVEKGNFSVPIYNSFAYNSEGSHKIAENIDPKNVFAVSLFGAPKIIYDCTKVLSSDTDMSTLVEIAKKSTMPEVIEYAKTIVSESVKSEGMFFSAFGENGSVTYQLDGYDKSNTLFSFSRNGNRIFAFVRDTQGERLSLYTNSINSNLKPSGEIGVDTGVSSYRITDDSVVYLKSDLNSVEGDVYYYNGENNVKLSNSANAFIVENYKDVFILKNHNSSTSQQTADYYLLSEKEEHLVNESIVVGTFECSDDGRVIYKTSDDCLYISEGKNTALVAENVTEIILFA